jgi:hypothetical protein
MVDKFFYGGQNPDLAAYGLDQSVYNKFDELANLYVDGALPSNSIVDLMDKRHGNDQVLFVKE